MFFVCFLFINNLGSYQRPHLPSAALKRHLLSPAKGALAKDLIGRLKDTLYVSAPEARNR